MLICFAVIATRIVRCRFHIQLVASVLHRNVLLNQCLADVEIQVHTAY